MIGTISVEIQAANPSMPLFPLRAFINSPTSLRIRNVPKKIGNWSITKVYVSAAYPDNSIQSTECVLVGGVWVGTIAGSSMAGKGGDGYTVYADGIDENGEPVAGYILGKGQVEILSTDTITPGVVQYYVHLLEDGDVERHLDGDLWKDAETGAWFIWQDGQAWAVGDDTGLIDELRERLDVVDSTVSGLVDELGVVDGKVVALESDVEQIDSSMSELQANVETLNDELDTKADASELDNYATKVELQAEVDEIDSSLSEISANVTSLGTRIGAAETSIGSLNTNINALGVSVANLNASMSSVSASVTSLSDTKADKVKQEQIIVDIPVPEVIQPIYGLSSVLNLNQDLIDRDPDHNVWWRAWEQRWDAEDASYFYIAWVKYDPINDTFKSYAESSYDQLYFPSSSATENVINGIDDGTPRTDGRPQTGYSTWVEFFDAGSPNQVQIAGSAKYMYGKVNVRVLPKTVTYNVIYEDDMNETLEDYAPLQKQMTYEGDVLVPNKIDGTWASIDPAIGTLDLNASYMSQDTQKRVWWSAQVQYEPEPDTQLYIYAVACYDATNDTFKANVWHDEQSGLPQNLSDLGDTDEWGSFTRASGWASWRDFFYNAPEDEYVVSYGQTTNIDLFDHAFVKARWGGLFDVVYEGELVNAYATRQYVDEQIGNILTEEM